MFALGFAASVRVLESFDGDWVLRLQGRDFDGAAVAADGDHREVAAIGAGLFHVEYRQYRRGCRSPLMFCRCS
jgi:hypothetical protein